MKGMFKRVFSSKQPKSVSKSIRCPVAMWEYIELLAKDAGETPNAYIVLVLDQFLQMKLEEGKILHPSMDASKITAS
jgi:hypothetical protein